MFVIEITYVAQIELMTGNGSVRFPELPTEGYRQGCLRDGAAP
jgi:hypothetical protein